MRERIIEYIREKNITVSELEKALGVSNAVISRMVENKPRYPTIETVIKLANLLGGSLDDLLREDSFSSKLVYTRKDKNKFDTELMSNTLQSVMDLIREKNEKIKSGAAALEAIANIYDYCRKRNLKELDKEVTEYIVDKISVD